MILGKYVVFTDNFLSLYFFHFFFYVFTEIGSYRHYLNVVFCNFLLSSIFPSYLIYLFKFHTDSWAAIYLIYKVCLVQKLSMCGITWKNNAKGKECVDCENVFM